MNAIFKKTILKATGAKEMHQVEVIQSLWSGYGSIIRYGLTGCKLKTVIVKHVRLPDAANHPRGWNTDISHLRKIKSYQVETVWYTQWSSATNNSCRIPTCYAVETLGDEVCIVLEDLDAVGFPIRKSEVSKEEFEKYLNQ